VRRYYTPALRLLNFLMEAGGYLTLWQIARKSSGGRLLALARPELEGLIVEEKGKTPNRGQRSGRPCTRVFLTAKGWAACSMLRPDWQPRRLPVDVLKAWLKELQAERDPWALSQHQMPPKEFEQMRKDAAELARLKSIGHIRPPLKRFGPKPGIQPANGFTRRDGSSPAPGEPVPPPAPRPIAAPAEHRFQVTPPTRARSFADDLAAIQGSQLAGIGEPARGFSNDPKPEIRASSGETRSEVVARAKASGHFFDGAFHTTDNQVVGWMAWAAWTPK
jgi:hypothetical protein